MSSGTSYFQCGFDMALLLAVVLMKVIVVVSGDKGRSYILSLTKVDVLVGMVVRLMAWSMRWVRAVFAWSWWRSLLSGVNAASTSNLSAAGTWYSLWRVDGMT